MAYGEVLRADVISSLDNRYKKIDFYRQNADPALAGRLSDMAERYPWMSPSSLLALSKGNASPEALAKLDEMRMRQEEPPDSDADGWFKRNVGRKIGGAFGSVYGGFKRSMRYLQAIDESGADLVYNLASGPQNVSPEGLLGSPRVGAALTGVDVGSGFFLSEDFMREQEQRSIAYRGRPGSWLETTKYGEGATAGRAVRDMLNLDPTTVWGNSVSGGIDAFVSIAFSPLLGAGRVGKAVKTVRKANQRASTLRKAGIDVTETRAYLARTADEVPSSGPDFALVERLRKADSIEEIRRIRAERGLPDDPPEFVVNGVPRTLLEGELVAVPKRGTVQFMDDIDLMLARGEIDSRTAAQLRDERGRVFSELRQKTEQEIWDTSKAMAVLKHDPRAVYLAETIAGLDPSRPALAHRIRRDIFRGKISLEDAEEMAQIVRRFHGKDTAVSEVQKVLVGYAERLRSVQSIDVINLEKLAGKGVQVRRALKGLSGMDPTERIFSQGEWRRIFGWQYTPRLGILGSSRQRMSAVDDFERFVDATLPQLSADERLAYVERFMKGIVEKPVAVISDTAEGPVLQQQRVVSQTGAYQARDVVEEVVERMLKEEGVPAKRAAEIRKARDEFYDEVRSFAAGAGDGSAHDAIHYLVAQGLMTPDEIIQKFARQGIYIESIDELTSAGPELLSDLLNRVVVLPDPDVVRGLTRNKYMAKTIGQAFRSAETGEVRGLWQILDYSMNAVWRKTVLLQVGYLTRNLLDGQARAWMTGHYSLFNNPLMWISYITSNKRVAAGLYDIRGKMMTADEVFDLAKMGVDDLPMADRIIADAMNTQRWEMAFGDPVSTAARVRQTGGWKGVNWAENDGLHTIGVVDQLRKIHIDPAQRIYMMFGHLPEEQRVARVLDWLYTTKEGKQAQAQLIDYYGSSGLLGRTGMASDQVGAAALVRPEISGGVGADFARMGKQEARIFSTVPDQTGMALRDRNRLLSDVVARIIADRAHQFDQVPEFVAMAVSNRVPVLGANGRAVIEEITMSPAAAKKGSIGELTGRVWSRAESIDGETITRNYYVVEASESTGVIRVIELTDDVVWNATGKTENYSDSALELVQSLKNRSKSLDPDLRSSIPETVGYAERVAPDAPGALEKLDQKIRAMGQIVFSGTYDGPSKVGRAWSRKASTGNAMIRIEKIPFIREKYHQYVLDNLTDLTREEALRVRQTILDIAGEHGMTPNQAMGGARIGGKGDTSMWDRLNRIIDNPDTRWGRGNLEELSDYAYLRSTNDMTNLFFDAATRSNLDASLVMRTNLAFVAAWANILADFGQLTMKHPSKVYRIHRTMKGLGNARFDSNRREGFFAKNPITGEYQYAIPVVDRAFARAFGTGVGLEANVRGLSVGLQVLPSLNPIGNVSATYILKALRKFGGDPGNAVSDAFEKSFMEYGSVDTGTKFLSSFFPASWRKMASAIAADRSSQAGAFANNYVEASQVLAGSGGYDLQGENRVAEMARLEDDAANIARWATAASAFFSFLGPAAANPEFYVETKLGSYPFALLARELNEMREEDYETGLLRFIATFGPTVKYMVAGKTKSEVPGLSATEPFYEFQKKYETLFDRHKFVAGYLAPEGDVFYWEARQLAMDKGLVRPLRGKEMIEANEYAIGAALYRAERLKFGTFPTTNQQSYLREYRKMLSERFPGYPPSPKFDTAKLPTFITRIREAISEPEWANLPISGAIRDYLDIREQVLAQLKGAGYQGFSSKAVTKARAYMRSEAAILSQKVPEFARIFSRVFASEVVLPGEADDLVDESLVED